MKSPRLLGYHAMKTGFPLKMKAVRSSETMVAMNTNVGHHIEKVGLALTL
jgi:hypothetical protein